MFSILKAGGLALLFSTGTISQLEMKVLIAGELEGHPNKEEIMEVIECESGFNHLIQSQHKDPKGPNGKENSWGLVQINLDYNPQVKMEQALDWKFSLEFIKQHFEDNNQSWMWKNCWQKVNKSAYGR